MILETVVVGPLQVNCYILGDEQSKAALVIDPGDNAPAILAALDKHGLHLRQIALTHAHFDHLLAARSLQTATGASFWLHPADRFQLASMQQAAQAWIGVDPGEPPRVDGELVPGNTIGVGEDLLEIRATPGHSPGGVSFVDHAHRRVFTGDALFAGSIGRTDLPGADQDALLEGIRTQLLTLPDDYAVLPGHGPATTVGRERRANPFLAPDAFGGW
jgi:hydroxyacylglutathione hydrolase